jgi:hypothetical protein
MEQFLWTPGKGVDALALARLRAHFPKPAEPMGEAWFMGNERKLFRELLGNLENISTQDLQQPFAEIATGISAFGPMEEWASWYHYLLGALLPRSHDAFVSYLSESLLTGFMAIYPNGIYREPYAGFRDDVLFTLGRCMMDSMCWSGSDIAFGKVLRQSNDNPNRVWGWWDASGDLAASMCFCLKYLPESSVEPWLRSVFDIPSPHWRAQIIVWLVGAHGILNNVIRWPSELSMEARPYIGWEWSHCLKVEVAAKDDSGALPVATFMPKAARTSALNVARSYFTDDRFLEWLDCISTGPYLESELAEIPSTFETLYVRQSERASP